MAKNKVVICSKFITFAVTKTTCISWLFVCVPLWFAQNSLPLRWQRQPAEPRHIEATGCDLLKIHYLCGDKDNTQRGQRTEDRLWFAQNSLPLRWQRQRVRTASWRFWVVICSKFITFAVTKTTQRGERIVSLPLWFAQNSLPLRWQRQPHSWASVPWYSCDLLKIHYLCGDKDNLPMPLPA